MLFLAILETKDVAAALSEAGLNKAQLASAVEEGRGSGHVDSATAGEERVAGYAAAAVLAQAACLSYSPSCFISCFCWIIYPIGCFRVRIMPAFGSSP